VGLCGTVTVLHGRVTDAPRVEGRTGREAASGRTARG